MKKWIWLVIAVIVGGSIGGYSYARQNQEMKLYTQAMQRGDLKIADKDYHAAKTAFQDALIKKQNDSKATRYLNQTKNFMTAQSQLDKANYKVAKLQYQRVANTDKGQKTLTSRAREQVKVLTSVISQQKEFNDIYKIANQQAQEGKYTDSNETLNKILANSKSKQKYYKDIVKKAQHLYDANIAVLKGSQLITSAPKSNDTEELPQPTVPVTDHKETNDSGADSSQPNKSSSLTSAENKAADNYKGKNEYSVSKADKEVNGKTITASQINDARNLFKSAGIEADAMSDQDIRNAIKGAADNHQSLKDYAKNNSF